MVSCGALPLAMEPSFPLGRRRSTSAARTAWTRLARSSPAMTRRPRRCGPSTMSRLCCAPPERRCPTSLRGRYLLRPMPTWPRPTVRSLRGSPAPEHLRSLPPHVLLALRCPGRCWRSAQSRQSRRIDFRGGCTPAHDDGETTGPNARGASHTLAPNAGAPDLRHDRPHGRRHERELSPALSLAHLRWQGWPTRRQGLDPVVPERGSRRPGSRPGPAASSKSATRQKRMGWESYSSSQATLTASCSAISLRTEAASIVLPSGTTLLDVWPSSLAAHSRRTPGRHQRGDRSDAVSTPAGLSMLT